MNRLLSQIHDLEIAYKRSQSPHIYADLVNAIDQLQSLLGLSYIRHLNKIRQFFYEFANKCGRPVAWSLHPRSTTTYIQKLKSPNAPDIYDPKDICHQFQQYYSTLYNIKGHFHDMLADSLSSKIREYIDETALPSLLS